MKIVLYIVANYHKKEVAFVKKLVKHALELQNSFDQIIFSGDFNTGIFFYIDKRPCHLFSNPTNYVKSKWFYNLFQSTANLYAHIEFATKPLVNRDGKDTRNNSKNDKWNDGMIDPNIPYDSINYFPARQPDSSKYDDNGSLIAIPQGQIGYKEIDYKENILVRKHMSGHLDNVLTNKYNGIKNIILGPHVQCNVKQASQLDT